MPAINLAGRLQKYGSLMMMVTHRNGQKTKQVLLPVDDWDVELQTPAQQDSVFLELTQIQMIAYNFRTIPSPAAYEGMGSIEGHLRK
ncbi:unnamed protein product [Diplocarpon coronariae]|uniref:Uncharacterized protein n=1 Tax=Diplocarpon coronariae TaxID=2795749 RepID=A0A218ZET5_9HELO|nr:hypothetical protein B2J93_1725 [Marssonina coronariae]